MSNKYGNIRTARDLEKAILMVKAEQKATGTGISKDIHYLLDSWRPSKLVKTFSPSHTLVDAGLGLVQGLKKVLAVPGRTGEGE